MSDIATYLHRKLLSSLKSFITVREIIVITGMRRVGKSSLLQMIYNSIKSANKVKLDIENPLDRSNFEEKNYDNIIKNLHALGINSNKKAYIFLDEIQSYPEIVKPIKYLYDHCDIKFIVTGSSSFYLKNLFPESLAGRKVEFELYPLDFEEFLYFKSQLSYKPVFKNQLTFKKNKISYEKYIKWYDEYMLYGGFPQVVLAEKPEYKIAYLKDIFKSYFQTDVLQLSNVKNISHLRDLILLLAARTGTKIDITRLASELGVTRETIYNYIAFLSGSFFFHFISRYGKNIDKEITSGRKIYICDNGIANQLVKLSEGQLLENAVYLNLCKYGSVRYYNDKNQKEIDFVLPNADTCFEVKRTAIPSDYFKLQKFSRSIGIKNSKIITYSFSDDINTIPANLLF